MTPTAELILTLDIGTSSVRALLFDRQARPLPDLEARRTHSVRTTPDGGAELDAEFLFKQVQETIDELLAKTGPRAAAIRAVACCTFWHSVVGVEDDGVPATPVLTWGETRGAAKADELRNLVDEKAYHTRTGAFFHPLFLPPKLLWLPERTRKKQRLMSFGEFLYQRLFGRTLCSVSMASGTGLLDINACDWDRPILKTLGVSIEQLSPLGDVKDAFSGLRDPWAKRWPALAGIPWTTPVGDGACNNLGSGCFSPDRIAVMVGTSGAMRVAWSTDKVEIPWGLWCYRADRRRVLLGGALNDGGNLVEWCRKTFQLGEPEDVERELAAMEPDAHGLSFLPFLAGERSPGWVARARAVITGLSLDTRPVQILRAGMEAVALRFALIYEILRGAVPQAKETVASGGALLKSPAWIQMLAEALGSPIVASAEPEASCRGAALLTMEALGWIQRLEDLPAAVGTTVKPDPRRIARYAAALARQKDLYKTLIRP